ncbi:MAG: PP2C family protein-serine/threonine phosphatase [Lachnospiraceae bacterium]|nr:PP2C family protein-serine/threonine phosphatase [Lachnospiraceae bacterium]
MYDKILKLAAPDSKRAMNLGLVCVFIFAITGFVLQMKRGFENIESTWAFSTGVEIMGIFICAIIYYSCLKSMDKENQTFMMFVPQIFVCALCLFLDEIAWLVQGVPEYALVNKLSNAILHINYYSIGVLIWLFICYVLNYRNRLIEVSTIIFVIVYVITVFINIADIFLPIFFTVDDAGVYERAFFYRFRPCIYLIPLPACISLFINSKEMLEKKVVAFLLIGIPALAELLTFFKFGLSMKPAAILMAIILNFGILVARLEKSYLATKNELDIASRIQEGLLPNIFPAFPDRTEFDIYASATPAKEVGGDFYDFFMIDDSHLAILIADVSDKGIGAALFMSASKIIIKTRALLGGSPAKILKYADQRIAENNEMGMFVTVWMAIIDLETGQVNACNAGHEYPAILKRDNYCVTHTEHGAPLAFIPDSDYPEISFKMNPGDRLFLYTDGVTDAKSHSGARFKTENLVPLLNANKDLSDEELVNKVIDEVTHFMGNEEQFDDITMLSFTYKG